MVDIFLDGAAEERREPGSQSAGELYGQAIKCIWWMPWRQQAMKDVVACDSFGELANKL